VSLTPPPSACGCGTRHFGPFFNLLMPLTSAGSMNAHPPGEDTAVYSPGDIAWVLASTALVWIMIPGLGYFYSGLLRRVFQQRGRLLPLQLIGTSNLQEEKCAHYDLSECGHLSSSIISGVYLTWCTFRMHALALSCLVYSFLPVVLLGLFAHV
jgi:hypothetical protein